MEVAVMVKFLSSPRSQAPGQTGARFFESRQFPRGVLQQARQLDE
jgi:hypothetical protein